MRTTPSRILATSLVCLACLAAGAGQLPAESQAAQGNPFRALKGLFTRKAPEKMADEAAESPAEPKGAAEPVAETERGAEPGASSVAGNDAGARRGFSLKRLFGIGKGGEDAQVRAADEEGAPLTGSRADKFVVKRDRVPVFFDGPLQNRPPDVMLEKGVIVSVVKPRKGWTDVLLESGQVGTVATDLIRKAKASDFPAEHLDLVIRPGDGGGRSVALGDPVLDDVDPIPVAPPDLPEAMFEDDGGIVEPFATPMLLLPPIPGGDLDDADALDLDAGEEGEAAPPEEPSPEGS